MHLVFASLAFLGSLALPACVSRPPPSATPPTDPRASATGVAATGPFRRVVTGLDARGRSAVVEDGPVPANARVDASSFDLKTRTLAPFTRYILETDGIWFGALPLPPGAPDDPLRGRVDFADETKTEDINDDELDERYQEAVQIVTETRQASISMLQRRLRVGYNRAARMIEIMEQQGLVGPSDGIKPREVLGPGRSS